MRLFEDMEVVTEERLLRPKGYTGLHAFHKYWGKKPLEVLGFLIEKLTLPGDLVIDPFMGSGTAGIEALRLNRRFIGCDLNPVATKLTELQLNPPTSNSVIAAYVQLEKTAKPLIAESYRSPHFVTPATHYLWDGANLSEVWNVKKGKKGREIHPPAPGDFEMVRKFEQYQPRNFRQPQFFSNARINAKSDMCISELFTGRAVRNIDILLDAIRELPAIERETLSLALTASAGQMSKMVFAITGRGKTTGSRVEKTEVGSWVIGFWQPLDLYHH